jgi:hypothetical protein
MLRWSLPLLPRPHFGTFSLAAGRVQAQLRKFLACTHWRFDSA